MVTLEISSTDIRLMETSGGKVVNWASYSLEQGMFDEEGILDPQALSAAVRRLMVSSGIHARDVTASVSGLYSISRIVLMPTPVEQPVTKEAVLEVARDVIPLTEEDLYISWQTVAAGEGGQQVLVVGVPRDVIDSEMRVLKSVGINPRTLDLKAMALARAVNREQALILNIEPASFDIVMVVDGLTEAMHTTAWQQENFSLEEAAEHLVSALEITVSFYDSHHPGSSLDPATPLFITGQMSGNLALIEQLQAVVEYPIEPLDPPLECPAHLPISQYAVNIGLALKGTAASKNLEQAGNSLPDINLLPQAYRPWRPSAKQIYFFCAILALLALLFPLYQLASGEMAKTSLLQTRYDALNSLLQQRQLEIKSREPLQKAIDEYNTIVNMGGGFSEDVMVINSQAERFAVGVESITHQGNTIKVVCQAHSYSSFRDYLTALEESGRFLSPIPEPERFPYLQGGTVTLTPKSGE